MKSFDDFLAENTARGEVSLAALRGKTIYNIEGSEQGIEIILTNGSSYLLMLEGHHARLFMRGYPDPE